jgi:hypothetical protein
MKPAMRPWSVKRLFRFPWRSPAEIRTDVADEFAFHLDMRTDELVREGLTATEARAQALREFGNRHAGLRACAATGDAIERQRRLTMLTDELRQTGSGCG